MPHKSTYGGRAPLTRAAAWRGEEKNTGGRDAQRSMPPCYIFHRYNLLHFRCHTMLHFKFLKTKRPKTYFLKCHFIVTTF